MNKALLIGVNEYAKQTGLAGCVNDVLDVEALLRSRNVVDANNIVVLTDKHATKAAIVQALIDLVDDLETGDRGYVHFSGHGVRMPSGDVNEPDGMDEVLCPHDFEWTADTSVSDNELLAILNKLELGARIILSIDSCHSGDFLRGLGGRGRPRTLTPPSGFRTRGPTLHGFRSAANAPNVTFVSACSPWQTAADASFDGRANGAFTYYFLQELASNGSTSTLDEVVAAIEAPLQGYAMTPVAENGALAYLTASAMRKLNARALAAFASPLRTAPSPSRAATIVFEQHWQIALIGQPIEVGMRISASNGELTGFVITRGFGNTMTSPPIRISGNLTFPIQLGFFGVEIVVTISDWAFGRDSIDFTLQLDLTNQLPFVPRVRIARVPVHVDVTQLTRNATLSASSPADLVALLQLAQLGQQSEQQPSREPSTVAVYRDPRIQVVASGVAGWGPNWREDRIIRPFQDRPRPDGITRTSVQIGPQRGSGNVYVVGWLSNQETDFDFVLHMGNHFFGGWGEINWRVEGVYADIKPFPRATTTHDDRSGTNGKSKQSVELEQAR